MAEFSVEMKIVFGPDDGDGAVLQCLRIPHAFEPLVFAFRKMVKPLLMRGDSDGSIGAYGDQGCFRYKERTGGLNIVA